MDVDNIKGIDILDRVLFILRNKKIKQVDFFKSIGVSPQIPAHWRKGATPSLEVTYAMAKELGVSLEWLVTGEEVAPSYEDYSFDIILKRIDSVISEQRKKANLPHNNWDDGFYSSIEDIVSPIDFDNLINGRKVLSYEQLINLANKIGVSVQYLLTGGNISKTEYQNYYGSVATDDSDFLNSYHCLNDEKKKLIQDMIINLFKSQMYEYSNIIKSKEEDNN